MGALHGATADPVAQTQITPHEHAGAIPDPFRGVPSGSADNHHYGVGTHPSQFPQLRIQASENGAGDPKEGHQKPAHYRAPSGGGFHALAGQQQDARLDFTEMTLLRGGQGHQGCAVLTAPPCGTAVGMIPAQGIRIMRRGFAQPLRDPPDAHGTDGDTQQQPSQTCRHRIRRHSSQQSHQAGQRATDAARFHAQQIQQEPALIAARLAAVTRHRSMPASAARQPGDLPCVLAAHRLAASRTYRRRTTRRGGAGIHLALQRSQHLWAVLDLHFSLQ
jgi:hypothetical protein